jgi:DNA-binding YbaB/EbfC family protein
MQEKLGTISVTGSAGGGMAEIDLNGRLEVTAVRLAPEAVDPSDIGLLQDLIVAAFSDATDKARQTIQSEMASMTGGLGLPPGMMGM